MSYKLNENSDKQTETLKGQADVQSKVLPVWTGGTILAGICVISVVIAITLTINDVRTTWYVDAPYLAEMLLGIGTVAIGAGTLLTVMFQWGYFRLAVRNEKLAGRNREIAKENEKIAEDLQSSLEEYRDLYDQNEALADGVRKVFHEMYTRSGELAANEYPTDEDVIVRALSRKMGGFDPDVVRLVLSQLHERGQLVANDKVG